MDVKNFIEKSGLKVINEGENLNKEISGVYCCDLLSIAMSRIPANSAWVTVMGNVNTIAVAVLTEVSCVILAEGINPDENAMQKAKAQGVTLLCSDEPVFKTALAAYLRINE